MNKAEFGYWDNFIRLNILHESTIFIWSDKFMGFWVIINMLLIINIVDSWNMKLFNNTRWYNSWLFGRFVLIALKLIFIACWPLKSDSWHMYLTVCKLVMIGFYWLHFIFWEILFVSWLTIERNLHFLICILRNRLSFWFRWGFNKLRLVWRNTLKFSLRCSIILSWRFLNFLFLIAKLLWVINRLQSIRLKLIFIRATANKRNLINYFILYYLIFTPIFSNLEEFYTKLFVWGLI